MHDKDVKLELISQSVQEVLAGGKVRSFVYVAWMRAALDVVAGLYMMLST
jgi:hypothetical protein